MYIEEIKHFEKKFKSRKENENLQYQVNPYF